MQIRYYLTMMGFFTFANMLSSIFLGVFLWRLDSTYALLATYSMVVAAVVLTSFPLCSWLSRITSPMTTLRLGIFAHVISYGITLYYGEALRDHVIILGLWMGTAISLFAIGMHMAVLDMTKNADRDRFLYHSGFVTSLTTMTAPLLGGVCIENFEGMTGYLIIFGASCLLFLVAALLSLRIKGKPIGRQSKIMQVIKNPTREWKGMLAVMFGEGVVGGTYDTFLVSMMTFQIAGGEQNLGIFQTVSGVMALIASLWLARVATPERRLLIYGIGAVMVAFASGVLSFYPTIAVLVVFSILHPLAKNMLTTSIGSWTYAAIESDPDYDRRRLDYIVVREIPLGLGRIIGVLLFLWMRETFAQASLLTVSFTVFPLVFVLMIPILIKIWKRHPAAQHQPTAPSQSTISS
ncbi:MFS transporter [Brevibacillus dissolubilis]|uniref:MFS transporter n=1 Tax=Brevibacillus dissolubilis TaxID=1844116 RepID=UPI001117373F|nr:MFS transporter [Brevibacillus dissolubilis]